MNESMYVVWSPTKGLPNKRHTNQRDAVNEARRLCEMEENKGHEFIILRAVQSVQYRAEPYVWKQYSKKEAIGLSDKERDKPRF